MHVSVIDNTCVFTGQGMVAQAGKCGVNNSQSQKTITHPVITDPSHPCCFSALRYLTKICSMRFIPVLQPEIHLCQSS